MASIGCVANVYNEAAAIGGWIESAVSFFDDVRVYHTGPGGVYSIDGTIEVCEKWGVPVTFGSIDDGFGVVRTKAFRLCPCEWVIVLDADERVHRFAPLLECVGQSTPPNEADAILQAYDFRDLKTLIPNWENLRGLGRNLTVNCIGAYDQGAFIRGIADCAEVDAIVCYRRHWHDFSWQHPTQNWQTDPDWQMRFVRNVDRIYYDPGKRMHEQLLGVQNPYRPQDNRGPFHDHYHFSFKRMEVEQRAHDVAIYDAVHDGRKPPTWEEFKNASIR